MSTYTHRYIEVLIECIDGQVWRKTELPDPSKHVGEVWRIGNHEKDEPGYYRAKEGPGLTFDDSVYSWESVHKVETKWVPVKWYGVIPKSRTEDKDPYSDIKYVVAKDKDGKNIYLEENILWANNGGYVRDEYIGSRSAISNRGIPEDASDEVKKDICKESYAYDITWATLSEWETLFETAKEKFIRGVEERFAKMTKEEISRKLDEILERLKDLYHTPEKKDEETYIPEYEDTIEYMFDDEIWELFNIRMEIDRTEFILEQFDNNYRRLNARIIYYLA